MKSFCIKTNNIEIINYLNTEFENLNLNDIYYCTKKFKNYQNVIIHYNGPYMSIFKHNLSDILTNCIITFYESKLIDRLINLNYFYFDHEEKMKIKQNCLNLLYTYNVDDFYFRKDTLWLCVYNYLQEFNKIILDGFVNFRISSYVKSLDYLTDICVNNFIIEKEYNEFVDLLKLYINSKPASKKTVHLIYTGNEAVLLDEHKKIIPYSEECFDAKYLSDISFSNNDNILNTLLTILPQKITIHLIAEDDEFIKTLELIFEDRTRICTDCNICKIYSHPFRPLKPAPSV